MAAEEDVDRLALVGAATFLETFAGVIDADHLAAVPVAVAVARRQLPVFLLFAAYRGFVRGGAFLGDGLEPGAAMAVGRGAAGICALCVVDHRN